MVLGSCIIIIINESLFSARGVAMQFHMTSMTKNWTTTTQVVKLSAHLLSMLYCCAFISRMRIVQTVTLVKAGLFEQSFPNCDHVMQHERSVAHRQYTYTHTHTQRHWHAGIHNTVCIDQLTCTQPGNKHLAQ